MVGLTFVPAINVTAIDTELDRERIDNTLYGSTLLKKSDEKLC
jgi:hypothetical protein